MVKITNGKNNVSPNFVLNAIKNKTDLEKQLIIVNNTLIRAQNPNVQTLADFYRIKQQHQADFDNLSKLTPLSPTFKSSMPPLLQKIDPTLDYRAFTSSSQFSDININYNIQTQCYAKSVFDFIQINESKNQLFNRIIIYRDAFFKGDEQLVLHSQTYTKNDSYTDYFHSFEFEIKKRIYYIAQKEGKLKSDTLQAYDMLMKASSRKPTSNVYIDKKDVNKLINPVNGHSSYNNIHELAVASVAASSHPNYMYYVTLDRSKADIDKWLIGLGYIEIGSIHQGCPDLVIIDFFHKRYMYFDVKNCNKDNINKFLNPEDQYLVFLGHLSQQDRLTFVAAYKSKQLIALERILKDPNVDKAYKSEAQKVHANIKQNHYTDEELFTLDPFVSNTSSIASTENLIDIVDPLTYIT